MADRGPVAIGEVHHMYPPRRPSGIQHPCGGSGVCWEWLSAQPLLAMREGIRNDFFVSVVWSCHIDDIDVISPGDCLPVIGRPSPSPAPCSFVGKSRVDIGNTDEFDLRAPRPIKCWQVTERKAMQLRHI